MVILENKHFIVMPEFPNTDFTNGDALYVVDDNSDLAVKIKANVPYYDFVVDANGNLIDITPTERPAPVEPIEPITVDDLAVAVAEIAEQQEQDKLEVEMALAELAEMIAVN